MKNLAIDHEEFMKNLAIERAARDKNAAISAAERAKEEKERRHALILGLQKAISKRKNAES